jgi:hypothetical protein
VSALVAGLRALAGIALRAAAGWLRALFALLLAISLLGCVDHVVAEGENGAPGAPGAPGQRGPAGERGPAGAPGPAWTPTTYVVTSTVEVEPGDWNTAIAECD